MGSRARVVLDSARCLPLRSNRRRQRSAHVSCKLHQRGSRQLIDGRCHLPVRLAEHTLNEESQRDWHIRVVLLVRDDLETLLRYIEGAPIGHAPVARMAWNQIPAMYIIQIESAR